MEDEPIFADEFIDKYRVALVDNMRWLLPLKYALAAVALSEEEYNHIKRESHESTERA